MSSCLDHLDRGPPPELDNSAISDSTLSRQPNESTATSLGSIGSRHEPEEAPVHTTIGASSQTSSMDQVQDTQLDTHYTATLPAQLWLSCVFPIMYVFRGMKSSWAHIHSLLDVKTAVRFVVVIFSYIMGIATAYSVGIAPGRPDNALPSIDDDGFPLMIAQVAASLLSPLIFTIISTSETSTPLRQRVISFYYGLLVVGVLMSFVSLLLYSLWPSGYRVTNATIMASLMFTVLGGWQFMEKCWNGVTETFGESEDIELGSRQV